MVSEFAIIDTNVVVAGLLTARADSPVARILDGMLAATFAFVVSEALLAEYRAVLLRPKLCRLHGLSEAEVDTILADLARHAIVLPPAGTAPQAPDPGDQFLWDLLASRADLVLVTGDKLLLQDKAGPQRVISPETFAARLQH
ncbi:putative toxin-antitoxin system toxin component, PIN family [Rhodoferax sediminis]|uniref:Putative toxin-antitoxin system toxin component, PIN family n=1 Tax=Rhodoferax sediminis TaxID=2509614 RepID=A0A515D697_9BURK|nr:putative toxin-antitoxin system toxin component, PIN family [Rhodoferax sediminis]